MIIAKRPIGTVAYMGGVASLDEEFCWSWGQMIQCNNEFLAKPGEYVHLDRARTSDHASARNYLARNFLGEWLFQTDTDHQFEPDLVCRMVALMDRLQLNVLTGIYCYRTPPYLPLIYAWSEKDQAFAVIAEWNEPPEDQPVFKVDCAGAGCLLVRRPVFNTIRQELGEEPFSHMGALSEDFSFFRRCMKLNIPVFCAPHIESYHIRKHISSLADRDLGAIALAPRETLLAGQ